MDKELSVKYYKIGEISKICNIPIRTLHHYDSINLLKPAKVDEINNYRYYTHGQMFDINTIKYFKIAGFSLEEIKKLMTSGDLKFTRQMIKGKTEEIEKNIVKLTALKNKLNLYLDMMDNNNQEGLGSINIHVKDIPISYIAYSRYTGPCNQDEFYLRFTKLTNLVEKNHLQMTGSMMAIYYDDYRSFNYSNADIEVCVRINGDGEINNTVRKFGGFLGAVAYHYGSYSTMNLTYKRMLDWLGKNNLVFTGGAVENYIIDGITTSCEDDYITEIILPVIKLN